jgi:flagellar protein FliS
LAYKNASTTYKETKVTTASPGQLIVMLYDESVKQLGKAVELMTLNKTDKKDPGRIETISKAILKAEEIITELMASLDFEQGGEIAKNLYSLYVWFNRELMEANISQDINRILTVKGMLSDLRSVWNKISNEAKTDTNREAVGLNIAG